MYLVRHMRGTASELGLKDVCANRFCSSLLRTQFTSRCPARHALRARARAVEEMWRYIAVVGTLNTGRKKVGR